MQGARSAEGIPGICDVTKMCDWRICQSISQTSSDLAVLDTRDVVQKYVVDNVYRIESLGCQQYDNLYGNGYSRVRTQYILEVVKLDNMHLFNTPHKRQRTNTGCVIAEKSDCDLFSRLLVASLFRDGNLNELFSHENQPCPPSLSVKGNSNWAPNRTFFDA